MADPKKKDQEESEEEEEDEEEEDEEGEEDEDEESEEEEEEEEEKFQGTPNKATASHAVAAPQAVASSAPPPPPAAAGAPVKQPAPGKGGDDDEFEFGDNSGGHQQKPAGAKSSSSPVPDNKAKGGAQPQASAFTKISNQHHDEAIDVGEDDHTVSPRADEKPASKSAKPMTETKLSNAQHDLAMDVDDGSDAESDEETKNKGRGGAGSGGGGGAGRGGGGGPPANAVKLSNAQHDEAVDVDDNEDVSSNEGDAAKGNMNDMNMDMKNKLMQQEITASKNLKQVPQRTPQEAGKVGGGGGGGGKEESESSSEDEDTPSRKMPGGAPMYNPADFANLKVSKEIKDLFQYITAYTAPIAELDCKLKPFIPDYIPSVGDIDTFVKIGRPDTKPDNLGLTVLDEPSANPSNPSVVKIALAYKSKSKKGSPSEFVETIEEAQKRPALIEKWVSDISNIHRQKPPPNVNYSKPMPDVENLLQVWPSDFEDVLCRHDLTFPGASIDLELYQYVSVICAILDIPVYSNLIESLHELFTLYSEFKANQHFQNVAELSPPGTLR